MSQAHEKGHYREHEEGETFDSRMNSIRENLASVSASRKVTEEKLTELLKKVVDPEAKKLLKKTLRTLRQGPGEVKP
jgi:hypothetical protein